VALLLALLVVLSMVVLIVERWCEAATDLNCCWRDWEANVTTQTARDHKSLVKAVKSGRVQPRPTDSEWKS